MERIAIYPGSFSMFHDGHLRVIKKALPLFTKVYVVVTNNPQKNYQVNILDRTAAVKIMLQDIPEVEVISNENELTIDVALKLKAKYIIRGLRTQMDLQYELEMYDVNKMLESDIETIYFASDVDKRTLSSSLLKEVEKIKKGKKNLD